MSRLPTTLLAAALATGSLLAIGVSAQAADGPEQASQVSAQAVPATGQDDAAAGTDARDEGEGHRELAPLPEDWNLLHGLARHCQHSFSGRVVVNRTDDGADPAWTTGPVLLDLRACPPGGIVMAIAVADDRSRAMVLRLQSADQLSLRHLRHNDDGTPQPVTDFGGFSSEESGPRKAVFQANQISRDLFSQHNQPARNNSTWTLAMPDADTLVYEETSDAGELRLEFDLAKPVARPPLPWVEAAVR